MDFYKVIRSLEELLYEVASWFVFYPRTLWSVLVQPAATTRSAEDEQREVAAGQYTSALSPPLLLMLSILIAHGFELGLGAHLPEGRTELGKAVFGSDQNLLLLRSILFSIFPVVAATTLVGRRKLVLDQRTLRAPFFSQCYLAAPFVLAVSLGGLLARTAPVAAKLAGAALLLAGCAWYLWAQTGWFRERLDLGTGRAFLVAATSFLKGLAYMLLLAVLLGLLAG
jgi:hypothetical protein